MRATPVLLAKKDVAEAAREGTILYSFFPAAFLFFASLYNANGAELVPRLASLALVLGSLDVAFFMAREKDKGIVAKLLLSTASSWSIAGGKLLSGFTLGLLKSTLILAVLKYSFGGLVSGNASLDAYWIAWFYAASSLVTLLAVSLGLLCFSLCGGLKAALLYLSLLALFAVQPAIFQSGAPARAGWYDPFGSAYGLMEKLIAEPQSAGALTGEGLAIVPLWIVILYLSAGFAIKGKPSRAS
ncbi:MAG: hypothetical protein JTT11_01485 [Candidatus Brockarchaeota archaeon]|nr:hypothetical protein [Candidatus Brockarchaeota archaeon]